MIIDASIHHTCTYFELKQILCEFIIAGISFSFVLAQLIVNIQYNLIKSEYHANGNQIYYHTVHWHQ